MKMTVSGPPSDDIKALDHGITEWMYRPHHSLNYQPLYDRWVEQIQLGKKLDEETTAIDIFVERLVATHRPQLLQQWGWEQCRVLITDLVVLTQLVDQQDKA
jgi:hypothetical protein